VTGRGVVTGVFLVVAGAVAVGVVLDEQPPPSRDAPVAQAVAADPLADLRFDPTQRQANLQRLGFDEAERALILGRVDALAQSYAVGQGEADRVGQRLGETEDESRLLAAVCGRGSALPVRYGAMEFLVTKADGQLRAVNLRETSGGFQPGDWFEGARVASVYDKAELSTDRKADATRMALAAILAGRQEDLLADRAPWGRGLFSGWSWAKVKAANPGVETRLFEYVALLHLVLESATADGGLCAT
jgi:hypothetical protein